MIRPSLTLAALILLALPAAAQEQGLGAGAAIPDAGAAFTDAAGRSLTLGGSVGSAGLVVAFWSDTCPWAERNADRLAALASEYARAGVAFVAVGAGESGGAGAASAQQLSDRLGMPFVTNGARLAEPFGVASLPTVFFFGRDGRLVYEGAIDDSPADADAVEVPYLRQAMDEYLAELPVSVQRTAPLGCALRPR